MSLLVKAGGSLIRAFQGNAVGKSSLTTGAIGGGLATLAESIESSVGSTGETSVGMVAATGKTMKTLTSRSLTVATAPNRMSQDDINRSNGRIQAAKYKQDDLKQIQLEVAENGKLAKAMIKTAGLALKAQTEVGVEQAKFVGDNAESIAKLTGEVGTAMGKAGRLTGRTNLRRAFATV